jgi:hypothetical protein
MFEAEETDMYPNVFTDLSDKVRALGYRGVHTLWFIQDFAAALRFMVSETAVDLRDRCDRAERERDAAIERAEAAEEMNGGDNCVLTRSMEAELEKCQQAREYEAQKATREIERLRRQARLLSGKLQEAKERRLDIESESRLYKRITALEAELSGWKQHADNVARALGNPYLAPEEAVRRIASLKQINGSASRRPALKGAAPIFEVEGGAPIDRFAAAAFQTPDRDGHSWPWTGADRHDQARARAEVVGAFCEVRKAMLEDVTTYPASSVGAVACFERAVFGTKRANGGPHGAEGLDL